MRYALTSRFIAYHGLVGPTRLPPSFSQRKELFFVFAAPFFLNDFFFIALNGTKESYLVYWFTCALVLVPCSVWSTANDIAVEPSQHPGSPHRELNFLTTRLFLLILIPRLIYHCVEIRLVESTGWDGWFQFQQTADLKFGLFDLAVGLFLLALSEELVFRKFALSWLKKTGRSNCQILHISAALFGFSHWGNGPAHVFGAYLVGLLFMGFYMKHKRLLPLVFAHHWVKVIALA